MQRQRVLLAQWSAGQPAGDALPAAWLAPMPQRLMQPRFWMAAESQFQRESRAADLAWAAQGSGAQPSAWPAWLTRFNLGYLPHLTTQPQTRSGWLFWRNGVGNILIKVAHPAWRGYPLCQADLGLYQAALELSQQLNAVPAAERTVWWQRQPLHAGLRDRLSLAGGALLLRSWRGEAEAAHAPPVRFPLRPS